MKIVSMALAFSFVLFAAATAQTPGSRGLAPPARTACTAGMSCPSSAAAVCSNHGRLVAGLCACAPGWSGSSCEALAGSICSGHGSMTNGRCICSTFWMGPDCSMAGFSLTGPVFRD